MAWEARCEGDGTGARARQRRRCEEDDAGLGKVGRLMGCGIGPEKGRKRESRGDAAQLWFFFFCIFLFLFRIWKRRKENR